ncbi:MAG: nucleotidyltransferase family protein [Syntrophotaleaceae bacterium]
MTARKIDLPLQEIAELCRRYRVRELSVFGSFLGEDFRPESDIDLLVEFAPDAEIGFLDLARMGRELSGVLHRPVDLVPKAGLKPKIRDEILSSRKVLYAA